MGRIIAGVIGVIVVVVVAVMVFSFRGYSVPSDMVAVHVGAGPFEASTIKGDCIPSSTRGFLTNDDYEYFPTSEREWDATGQDGSDAGRMQSVTKDSVQMYVPVTVRFTLITECETLQNFYTRYARRYQVEFENDGSYNKEWLTLLRKLVADPSDATLDRIIQDYEWRKVWNDPTTKVEIETRLNEALQAPSSLLVTTAKGQFFEGISVLVGKPEPVNPDLAEAVASEQTKVAEAQAAEAQANADKAKAEAETKVARAEGAKQRAIIRGFGGINGYLKYQCILAGCNPYQPTYGSVLTPEKEG
jgi:regulator of protease activity HflC (stomatin/prohibitin superfamily)